MTQTATTTARTATPARTPLAVLHGAALSGYVLRLRLLSEGLALSDEITVWMEASADLACDEPTACAIRDMVAELAEVDANGRFQREALTTALNCTKDYLEDAIRLAAERGS